MDIEDELIDKIIEMIHGEIDTPVEFVLSKIERVILEIILKSLERRADIEIAKLTSSVNNRLSILSTSNNSGEIVS